MVAVALGFIFTIKKSNRLPNEMTSLIFLLPTSIGSSLLLGLHRTNYGRIAMATYALLMIFLALYF